MPLPTMTHSSSFLRLPATSSPHPPPADDASAAYAVVVLNQRLPRFAPLLWDRGILLLPCLDDALRSLFEVWCGLTDDDVVVCGVSWWVARAARLRVCADGGANRVFDGMPELLPAEDPDQVRMRSTAASTSVFFTMNSFLPILGCQRYKPDVIKGDMDSIRPEVKEYYSNLGAEIVDESHDQDTTDLHKCVSFITRNPPGSEESNLYILVLGALGGRFDHEMGNINVLYRFSNIRIVLLSDDCSIFLLPKTHSHEIHIERSIEGPHCGLIPMGSPSASTTTTGLRWNLDNTSMSYGGLISTSNIVEEETVRITSDSDLIWTISLRN
uniref:thiamine diphosphokinase n=1 Tax=Oryza glumipatula TaxID=40148 RepID=A0A0D9YJL6_9ORYZ